MDFRWIEAPDGKRRTWRSEVQESESNISYTLLLEEYDCKHRTIETKKTVFPNGVDENTTVDGSNKVMDVIPGTRGETFLQKACGISHGEIKIPGSIDPIIYLQRSFKAVRKQDLSKILSSFISRKNSPVPPLQAVAVLRSFDIISKRYNLPNLIDSRRELIDLFDSVGKNVKDKRIQDDIKAEFRKSFDMVYFVSLRD